VKTIYTADVAPNPTPCAPKQTPIGKRIALAAIGTLGVAAALSLGGTIQISGTPLNAPDSTVIAACSPPWMHEDQPCVTVPDRDHVNSGPDGGLKGDTGGDQGGGKSDTGENPGPVQTGNDPGDPDTGGGGGSCTNLDILCHEPK
jgi:hypothetical protein